jgi:lipopolysaccharide heptosyltransferase II
MNFQDVKRIALIQPSRIGDIIFSLPTLAGLRRVFPRAYIAWLVDERCQDLVWGHPDLNEVIVVPFKSLETSLKKGRWPMLWETLRRLKQDLRRQRFDLSLDLHGLAKSALLVLLVGARYRLGSANTNGMKELSGLISREIPPGPGDVHTIERNLALIRFLGGAETAPEFKLTAGLSDRQVLGDLLAKTARIPGRPLVVMHPGAGWVSRRWPANRFAALADRLYRELPADIAVIGGAEGGSREDRLFEELFRLIRVPVINLVNRLTLKMLLALLEEADLFIGNEAGPMHMASALAKPLVALIGPTRPELTGPYGSRSVIVRKATPCAPCRERNCTEITCMRAIEVGDVFAAVQKALELH